MRLMYDSVNWQAIPQDSDLVAGYVDGRYSKWPDNAWYAFPGKTMVRIAVLPTTNDGVVLDVEPGDAEPQEVPGWLTMRRQAGVDPTVYCSSHAVDLIRSACATAGVAEPHWWIADPDNDPTLPDGAVAKQYRWEKNVDYSVVADYWPGVDPATTVSLPIEDGDVQTTDEPVTPEEWEEVANLLREGKGTLRHVRPDPASPSQRRYALYFLQEDIDALRV